VLFVGLERQDVLGRQGPRRELITPHHPLALRGLSSGLIDQPYSNSTAQELVLGEPVQDIVSKLVTFRSPLLSPSERAYVTKLADAVRVPKTDGERHLNAMLTTAGAYQS
jgi:hypothetical protein